MNALPINPPAPKFTKEDADRAQRQAERESEQPEKEGRRPPGPGHEFTIFRR
jgi:hypothetical protein